MFLPVVVLHRYGWEGFLIFAIPNVIGCAAFGYILKTPERSKELVKKYGTAMALFSVATVAFHVFFISMILHMHGLESYAWPIFIGLFIFYAITIFLSKKNWMILGSACWVISIGIGLTFLPFEVDIEPTKPLQEVYWLLPITTFGFLLCPYLDPTFHRALQESPSKHSFGIFGVAFTIMLGVTCLYHNVILEALPIVLLAYIFIQSAFTISAHLEEGDKAWGKLPNKVFAGICTVSVMIALVIASKNTNQIQEHINDYLRFFVFYGLVFPGIVAVFMLRGKSFTWLRIALFAIVCVISLPLLESAYIGNQPWLAIFPVIILLTWAFVDNGKKERCIT